ncbi:MAG: hypothetical protein K2N51_11005 [Lachnospiraceae bacterium]|nr:hypothetical protein [Lachnospiraceae bacterium]
MDKGKVVVMEIPAVVNMPINFKETEFICVGSYKKKLDVANKNFAGK